MMTACNKLLLTAGDVCLAKLFAVLKSFAPGNPDAQTFRYDGLRLRTPIFTTVCRSNYRSLYIEKLRTLFLENQGLS
ncbi:hypothetical protein [Nostoc sp. MG11]|uniref:hypothetical protein n=1 Tax=Nostoc sp. MG11 TaxID=2721166 RepID=UPI001868BADE|nr:hypothetical protein [Nostoc sp. MG11]